MDIWPNVILDFQGHSKGQKGALEVLKMEISDRLTSRNTVTLGKEWKFEMVN
jgi:hypothetical protein